MDSTMGDAMLRTEHGAVLRRSELANGRTRAQREFEP